MQQENILKKYNLTKEEFNEAIDAIYKSGIMGKINSQVSIAIAEMLVRGDIDEDI